MKGVLKRIFSAGIILTVLLIILGGASLVIDKALTSANSNEKLILQQFRGSQPDEVAIVAPITGSFDPKFDASEIETQDAQPLPQLKYSSYSEIVPAPAPTPTDDSSSTATSSPATTATADNSTGTVSTGEVSSLQTLITQIGAVVNGLQPATSSASSTPSASPSSTPNTATAGTSQIAEQ